MKCAADRVARSLGREPYPWSHGAACGGGIGATPRTGTFARAGQSKVCLAEGTDGGALTTLRQRVREVWRRDVRPPSDRIKRKNPRPVSGAGFAMMLVCQ